MCNRNGWTWLRDIIDLVFGVKIIPVMLKIAKEKTHHLFLLISRLFLVLILTLGAVACSSLPEGSRAPAQKAALEAASPLLNRFYQEQAPIQSPSLSAYPVLELLPGNAFQPVFQSRSISFDTDGALRLLPGDYVIPVMTYCMKASGSSPSGFTYTLSRLQGARASLIQRIDQRALPRFSPNDVQALSWQLQEGLSYEELAPKSRKILDAIVPEGKTEIRESFLKKVEQEWNSISDKTHGVFPPFSELSVDVLNSLGEIGEEIKTAQEFRVELEESGDDYSRLRAMIETPKFDPRAAKTTPWSKIDDQVYARFITNGSFQDIGQIQIRVLSARQRGPSSSLGSSSRVDINSWIALPTSPGIQPLSFSLIVSEQGIWLTPVIIEIPEIAAALVGGILAEEVIDWSSFRQLKNLLSDVKYAQVQSLIRDGNIALQKAYDDLEKPLKDADIIEKTTKKTPDDNDKNTRQYTKSGGVKQLEKDFDKLPGNMKTATDGIPIKELPNGKTAVKRLKQKNDSLPTLEIQPQKTGDKPGDRLRIKVRYKP